MKVGDLSPLIVVGVVAVAAYFLKDTILTLLGKSGGSSDLPVCTQAMITAGDPCRVASPFPYLPSTPVIPGDLEYKNLVLCMLGMTQYCPEEADPITPAQPPGATCRDYLGTIRCHCYQNIFAAPSGNYDKQQDGWYCEVGY